MAFIKGVKSFVRGARESFVAAMASMKEAKLQSIQDDAQKAVDEGRTVFAYRIEDGSLNGSGSLGSVAEEIEVIEKVGWRLDQSTFTHDTEGNASAFLIFRRSEVASQAE